MLINTIASSSGSGNLSDSIVMVNNGEPISDTSQTAPFVIEDTQIGKLYVFSFSATKNYVSFQGLPDGKYAMFVESFNRSLNQGYQWWGYQRMTITDGVIQKGYTTNSFTGQGYLLTAGYAPYVYSNDNNFLGGFQTMFIKLND